MGDTIADFGNLLGLQEPSYDLYDHDSILTV